MNRLLAFVALVLVAALPLAAPAVAQQRIGYIDAQAVLQRLPEYTGVQQQMERQQQEWQSDLTRRQQALDASFREYQTRELLYTSEERTRRREEIARAEADVERRRAEYFGPEGQLFSQQQALMRPIQERLLAAVERVAAQDNYDYVFDKSGGVLMLFSRPQHDLSERVLRELGVAPREGGN